MCDPGPKQDGPGGFIGSLVRALVDAPQAVHIQRTESADYRSVAYSEAVQSGDLGFAPGREGRLIAAIWTLAVSAAKKHRRSSS